MGESQWLRDVRDYDPRGISLKFDWFSQISAQIRAKRMK